MATVRQIVESELTRLGTPGYVNGSAPSRGSFDPLALDVLMKGESHEADWLVEDMWPMGRQIHIHAARKAGKSLLFLWVACCLALGRDPFTGAPQIPQVVGYWDFEMSEDDIRERLEAMGFNPIPELILRNLHYYLHAPIAALDTEAGGKAIVQQAQAMGETVVMIDTMSRVISGDENSAETYIRFYRYTGQPLKALSISLARLDHEGHESGRSRGSSAKGDDVDIVWQLKPTDDGVELIRKAARISWVGEHLFLTKRENPTLSYAKQPMAWPKGTKEKAAELDEIGAPLGVGRTVAIRMLKDAGKERGATDVLTAALRYRKRSDLLL